MMSKLSILLALSAVFCPLASARFFEDGLSHILSDAFIRETNAKTQGLWVAERSFHEAISPKYLRGLMGVRPDWKDHMPAVRTSDSQTKVALADLPKEFDPREEWPECESIGQIMDQSGCGSCWAFGAVTAMSDRLCINSPKDKKLKVHVSPNHLLSCCKSCGYGCDGGYPSMAWRYWQSNGLVTGSDYDSKEGCQPYSLPPCNHGGDSSLPDCQHESTPRCEKSCQSGYTTPFNEDKSYGLRPETLPSDEEIIMEELMTNGPAEAAFTVYEDFINYKSGVYKHVNGGMLGGHAVKIMGWGEENGTPYWLIANSWNYGWGENGTFKIIRGEDNCGIESSIVAALPDYKKTQL